MGAERGDYACFNANGQIRYFQPGAPDLTRWDELHQDRDATLQRFADLFARLLPKLPEGAGQRPAIVEEGVTRLIRNPLQDFERCNLHFLQVGLGEPGLPQVDVVRCFNVLMYFDADFRRKAETWVATILRPDGLFLCGVDGPRSLEARYVVSRRENGGLVEKEFAFSLDNVRPLTAMPWFCLYDGERETFRLASAVGILRADDAFRDDFDERLDHLLEDKGICARQPNGYLGPLFQGLVPTERVARIEEVMEQLEQEGFVDRAAGVLRGAGLRARRNSAGHIAIDLDETMSEAF
jgi:SAM-dependent methyltransferase